MLLAPETGKSNVHVLGVWALLGSLDEEDPAIIHERARSVTSLAPSNKARAAFLEEVVTSSQGRRPEDFVKSLDGLSPEEIKRTILYLARLQQLYPGWVAISIEICESHEPRKEWYKIETKSTGILDTLQSVRLEVGMDKKQCLSRGLLLAVEWESHFNRAQGRIGLGNFVGAIEDLTEALVVRQSTLDYDNEHSKTEVEILYFRGKCLMKLNKLERAIVDFQGAHSCIRIIGDKWDGKPLIPMEIVKHLLMATAKQKQNRDQSRPLYSKAEREKIEKDLGLSANYDENYNCLQCGGTPPATQLKLCARCQQVWFCSKECQLRCWKEHHHHTCAKPVGLITCEDKARPEIETDFKELSGVTWIYGCGMKQIYDGTSFGTPFCQPRALLRDTITGRFFDALTDEDVYFEPVEGPACFDAIMAKPADKVEGNHLVDYILMKSKNRMPTEEKWLKAVSLVFKALLHKNYPSAEKNATAVVQMIRKDISTVSDYAQYRPWFATVTLIHTFMIRSSTRHQLGKLSMEDATAGLVQIESMMKWTSQLKGPVCYFMEEKVSMLFMRSQCLKRLEDFSGALSDLRGCSAIIQSFVDQWDDGSIHLKSNVVAVVHSFLSQKISLNLVNTSIQIVLALQKVKDGAARPHYSDEERAALEEELGLSRSSFDENTFVLPKIVNNENIGDEDTWAYAKFEVFAISSRSGERRVLVPDGKGGHFESITDEIHFVVSPEKAQEIIAMYKREVQKRGANFIER